MAYIIKPLVSEKANTLTDKLNQFSFIVRPEANKLQIKAEVEALYGVSVLARLRPATLRPASCVAAAMLSRRLS